MNRLLFSAGLGLCLLLTAGFQAPGPGYQVGGKAQNFKLHNVDDKTVLLFDNPAMKGYIVVFTCNTCPAAQAYESRIIALHTQYASQGYPVVAINANDAAHSPGDSFEAMQQRSKQISYPFPYLHDETQEVAKAFGARNTPTVYLVKRTGTDYVVSYIGAIDDNRDDPAQASTKYVQDAVNALLANKPVTAPTVKAVGCGIRWKQA